MMPFVFLDLLLLIALLRIIEITRNDQKRMQLEFNYIIRRYRLLAERAFKKKGNTNDQFKIHPLEQLQDESKTVVSERKKGLFALYKSILITIPKEYLKVVKNRKNKHYNYKRSSTTKWEGLRWHKQLIFELYHTSITTEDVTIVHEVLSIPIQISWDALRNDDILIFSDYIRLLYYPTTIRSKAKSQEIANLLSEIIVMWLRETAQFQIIPRIKPEPSDVTSGLGKFFKPLFLAFQDVLKSAFDNGDRACFTVALRNFIDIFKYTVHEESAFPEFYPHNDHDNILTTCGRGLKFQYSVLFGLSAWILHKIHEISATRKSNTTYFLEITQLFREFSLNEWTSLFFSLIDFDIGSQMEWDNWDIVQKNASVPVFGEVRTSEYLKSLYICGVLLGIIPLGVLQVEGFTQLLQSDLKFYGFDELLTEIETFPLEKLHPFDVEENQIKLRRKALLDAINKLKVGVEDKRKDEIRRSPLDDEKVMNFMNLIKSIYQRDVGIIDLFKHLELLKHSPNVKKKMSMFILLNKDGFIHDTNIVMDLVAEQIGHMIKIGHNRGYAEQCFRTLPILTRKDFLSSLSQTNDPMLFAVNRPAHRISQDLEIPFFPNRVYEQGHWLLWAKTPLYEGYVTWGDCRMPVFRLNFDSKDKCYILLERTGLGQISIYDDGDKDTINGIGITIEALNTEKAIDQLRRESTNEISDEELRLKVSCKLAQRMEITVPDLSQNLGIYKIQTKSEKQNTKGKKER